MFFLSFSYSFLPQQFLLRLQRSFFFTLPPTFFSPVREEQSTRHMTLRLSIICALFLIFYLTPFPFQQSLFISYLNMHNQTTLHSFIFLSILFTNPTPPILIFFHPTVYIPSHLYLYSISLYFPLHIQVYLILYFTPLFPYSSTYSACLVQVLYLVQVL
jgi:hypothetical protein